MDDKYYQAKKAGAHRIYTAQPSIHSPYFNDEIRLGPEGFRHLCVGANGERTEEERIRRFLLLPLALKILATATTVQEYRYVDGAAQLGKSSWSEPGPKLVQCWGFTALFVQQEITVKVLVRKVGKGDFHFWSVILLTPPRRKSARSSQNDGTAL
jgi:hypothetical protein